MSSAFASIFGDCNYTTFCKKTLNRTISVKLLKRDSPGAIYNDLLRWMGSVKADSCGKRIRGVSQMWMSALKKNDFHFFFFFVIILKCFLSNKNLIFQYSVLDKIRLDCKMYPSPLTHLLHMLSAYHRSKSYFLICQSIFVW